MKTSKNAKVYPVDARKLDAILIQKGLSRNQVSKQMGRGVTYITNRINGGGLHDLEAYWLEAELGIKPEDYAPVAPAKNDIVDIRSAVRGVVKDVINERFSDRDFINSLRDTMRPVITKALEEERAILTQVIREAIEESLK